MATIPGWWIVAGIVFSLWAFTALMMHAGLTIDLPQSLAALVVLGGLLAVRLYYVFDPHAGMGHRVLRDGVEYLGSFAAICLVGAVASYADAVESRGLVDARLQSLDAMLGFNWVSWYSFVANHVVLQDAGRTVYASIFVTPAILLGYFAWTGRQAEARSFIGAFWLAALVTLLLFHLMPAAGPLAFLWHGPISYMPTSALYQADIIPLLQRHELHQVSLTGLRGLVCAPSFHAASAVLYALTAWRIPRLRWPLVGLNVAMLLATPVEGTHYFIDIIAGAAVAIGAFTAMTVGMRRSNGALPSALHSQLAHRNAD